MNPNIRGLLSVHTLSAATIALAASLGVAAAPPSQVDHEKEKAADLKPGSVTSIQGSSAPSPGDGPKGGGYINC